MDLNIIVLLLTIAGGSYFFLFEPEHPYIAYLAAIAPIGWVLVMVKKGLQNRKENKTENHGPKTEIIDPHELIEKQREKNKV